AVNSSTAPLTRGLLADALINLSIYSR
ncbi:MAG: hypothetical protein QOK26_3994, partial [Pseudonocardiales bacterium]|nr:hypothetical protein [Pseudonocardiales bacterium]